jgi:hypothetical protein
MEEYNIYNNFLQIYNRIGCYREEIKHKEDKEALVIVALSKHNNITINKICQ